MDAEEALIEYLEMFYNLKRAGRALKRFGAVDFATTIAPGMRDVLLTGTPAHSRPMEPGDEVAVEITGLGRLQSTVVDWDVDLTEAGEQPAVSAQTLHVALATPEEEAERMVEGSAA